MDGMLDLVCQGNNKRPSKTEAMRSQAATEIVNSMVESGAIEAVDREASVEDIVKSTRYETGDGYKIARYLERYCHWDCDMDIAEQLGEFGGILGRIYDTAEDLWAKENPREPQFSDGTEVMWRGAAATVRGVYEYRPQRYKIRQGEMSGGPESYYTVPFEEVSAVT